ncbi:MAG: AAA family ATPase, partial [Blastocatellia bacterium]
IRDAIRYQYGFTLTPQRVVSEYLLVYKAFKPQRWFERWFDEETGRERYEFGPGLRGPRSVWEGATRPNSLFLSTAVQLNSEILRPVYDWFANRLIVYNELSRLNPEISIQLLNKHGGREEILDFLEAADISIDDITVETRQVPSETLHWDLLAGKTVIGREELEERVIKFTHTTDRGRAVFDLADESGGTRILLFLAAPMLTILRQGLTLVVDELDTSLHPLLLRRLVRHFHEPRVNTGAGQLIFTTHDASLLEADNLLRRDQIWFVDKERDQASRLFALAEFSPRKNEALGRGYLTGRYGGIPFLEQDLQEIH